MQKGKPVRAKLVELVFDILSSNSIQLSGRYMIVENLFADLINSKEIAQRWLFFV